MAYKSNDGRTHDTQADARYSDFQDELVGMGSNIMSGAKSAADRQREAAAEAALDDLEDAWKTEQIRIGSAIIQNYMNSQWDKVINIDASVQFNQRIYDGRIFAFKAIAYGKKGDYENALRMLPYFKSIGGLPDDYIDYSGNVLNFITNISNDLDSLVIETIKQAYSKQKGYAVTDLEFKQFHISFCEKEIVRNWTQMDGERLIEYWKFQWSILSGKKITSSEMKRIAGSNKRLSKMLLSKRNGFVSFLYALVVSFGAALAVDWYSTAQIERPSLSIVALIITAAILIYTFVRNGKDNIRASMMFALVIIAALVIILVLDWVFKNITALTIPFFFLFVILIPINYTLWRDRNNFVSAIMIALCIIGGLTFSGVLATKLPVLSNENMTVFSQIASIKDIISYFQQVIEEELKQ